MSSCRDEHSTALREEDTSRLELTLGDVADGMLYRLRRQNSALEKLRRALDDDTSDTQQSPTGVFS